MAYISLREIPAQTVDGIASGLRWDAIVPPWRYPARNKAAFLAKLDAFRVTPHRPAKPVKLHAKPRPAPKPKSKPKPNPEPEPDCQAPEAEPPRLDRMREAALSRFLEKSEEFSRAHESEMEPGRWERAWAKVTRWCKRLSSRAVRSRAPESPAPQADRSKPRRAEPPVPPRRNVPPLPIPHQRTGLTPPSPRPVPTWRMRAASQPAQAERLARAVGGARRARSGPPPEDSFIANWERAFDAQRGYGTAGIA
ncbi:hypothetical protein [Glycomyces buryatensis]|uniref:Uncharacterized protein n=1 Tax=Glycomyces buryatensis TaxID=2570927 RepID=A0A4S8Q9T3_9ACTN|nr:hypothetical protein [Glycomyces buryatensis]THV41223.1 hypothetical protein FAB82_12370 [Glycomyces buryatensis]